MKLLERKAAALTDPTTAAILRALRRARNSAARNARLHKVPLIYLNGRKIVRDRS